MKLGDFPPARFGLDDTAVSSLAPLTDSGLLRNGPAFTQDLEDGELSVYRSHDNGRHGTGFHAELVLARDSRVRVLVADTDRYPGARGLRLDGVYILADGEILTPPARP